MTMYFKTEVEGIVKDSSGALLNTDNGALDAYKKKKRASQTVVQLKERVDAMEAKLDQILNLLTERS